jgi:hypothetical protein
MKSRKYKVKNKNKSKKIKTQYGGNISALTNLIANLLIAMYKSLTKRTTTKENVILAINNFYKNNYSCFKKIPNELLSSKSITNLQNTLLSLPHDMDFEQNQIEVITNFTYFTNNHNMDDPDHETFFNIMLDNDVNEKLIEIYPQLALTESDHAEIQRKKDEEDENERRILAADISTLSEHELNLRHAIEAIRSYKSHETDSNDSDFETKSVN